MRRSKRSRNKGSRNKRSRNKRSISKRPRDELGRFVRENFTHHIKKGFNHFRSTVSKAGSHLKRKTSKK